MPFPEKPAHELASDYVGGSTGPADVSECCKQLLDVGWRQKHDPFGNSPFPDG